MSLGIYVHIPFCKAKCLYCDFNSYSGMDAYQEAYLKALQKEIESKKDSRKVDSLYIGGGTPTVLKAESLVQILSILRGNFVFSPDCEITVECNPATMQEEGFRILKEGGFNRLSIGLQSSNDDELRALGRIHSFEEFSICYKEARKAGFENISLDLMYGLPGQTMERWKKSLEDAISFHPEHISCYGLKLEEGTPLFFQNPILPDEDAFAEFYETCVNDLAEQGYERYEISNFSLPGKESRHNCKYWQCNDFIGFGAGAYSCVNDERYANINSIPTYCSYIESGKSVVEEITTLSLKDKMSEFCFLGLRMSNGISQQEFKERFHQSIEDVYGEVLTKNLRRGTLLRLGDRIFIPSQFLYVSNSILVDFIEPF